MTQRNKQRKQNYSIILTDLKNFKYNLPKDPTNQKFNDLILNSQHQLNLLPSKEMAHKLKLAKQNFLNTQTEQENG